MLIYIVDDNLDMCEFISFVLANAGYKVHACHCPVQALANMKDKQLQPTVLITDYNMPKMNGFEFLEIIREDSHLEKLCIFMLTTSDSRYDYEESQRLNVSGYFSKPFDFDHFVKVLKTIDDLRMLSALPDIDSETAPQILLVDDDHIVRTVIGKVLENSGYIIHNAIDGVSALQRLDTCTPDLIITDLSMPNMDGWELIKNLQNT